MEPRDRSATLPPSRPMLAVPDDEGMRVRLTWLLVFRAVVVTLLLGTALLVRVRGSDALFGAATVVVSAVAIVSYGTILAGALWMRRFGTRGVRVLAYGQLATDVVTATIVVFATGGVESIFVFVYSLSVLNAAAVLQRRGAMIVAGISATLYALVFLLEATHLWSPFGEGSSTEMLISPLFTNGASFFLVAYLAGYLTDQLKTTSESLTRARAELTRVEQLYRAVLESLPSGVLTIDEHDSIVYVNSAGAEILGNSPRGLVGKHVGATVPALHVELDDVHDRFERTVDVVGRGMRVIGGNVARLTGIEGLAGHVVVYQDLTELRRLQEDVGRAERLADLGRFAAGLAHEIRNPLAAMIGCLELLRSDVDRPLGDEGAQMLNIVHREAQRLSGLVSEFLTYARPAPPRVQDVELRELVHDTAMAARAGLDAGVILDVDSPNDVVARGDPGQLRQVLWNLVGNALHAVRSKEDARGVVRITLTRDDAHALLRVEDDGAGVPPELRARIFEPFFTTRADGTGLGLASSHQVLVQQGGALTVASSSLGGASFQVRLPLSPSPTASTSTTNTREHRDEAKSPQD